jgi:murein DD-endopeptidase MepM/ murein hydrolase activator NlpD
VHVVQRGENLFRIALRYNTTVEAIARANNIVNPRLIYVGQTLLIPSNEPTSQSTNATVAPPTATATPTPTISATATLTQEPTTSTPSLGFIEYISSERFVVFATTCFGAIGALVGLFTFVSTIVLSWQRTSRDLRQFQVEKIELEIEKLRRELEL